MVVVDDRENVLGIEAEKEFQILFRGEVEGKKYYKSDSMILKPFPPSLEIKIL